MTEIAEDVLARAKAEAYVKAMLAMGIKELTVTRDIARDAMLYELRHARQADGSIALRIVQPITIEGTCIVLPEREFS